MRAAVYARYSSENQRPESIDDQVSACRRFAASRGYVVLDGHVYSDEATSGSRTDRVGLAALVAAGERRAFEVVLVDDLSRLARDNYLMLSVLAELRFNGVRVVSVADGLDSNDEEATLGIQVRGIFNELQLRDLKKKTLRGQIGQKLRGFSVGEKTYGYTSVPVGTVRLDKKGRPRPDGYRMTIEPREAAVVLRVFQCFADGHSLPRIVRALNEEGVPCRRRPAKAWSPSTVTRILDNTKYVGHWVWNRTETRRDPKTGRRRKFTKPEAEWVVQDDESLRIVPRDLWDRVQVRRGEVKRTWVTTKGEKGFGRAQSGRQKLYPTHLLSGAMTCTACGNVIAQVTGNHGGYYGCLSASRGACDNKLIVRRTLAERVILGAVRERLVEPAAFERVLMKVEEEVARLYADVPETVRLKAVELESEERRLANFLDFVGDGRGSKALATALIETERRVDSLRTEVDALRSARDRVFTAPPAEWIAVRLRDLQELLERKTEESAKALRSLLGPVRLDPVAPEIGRPFYRALTAIDALALIEPAPGPGDPGQSGSGGGGCRSAGTNSLRWCPQGSRF